MRDTTMRRWLTLLILCLMAGLAFPAMAETPLRLGVLAYRSKILALTQWRPLADYLETALDRPVELVILEVAEMSAAASRGDIDVVITNPANAAVLQHGSGLSAPLVTLVTSEGGHALFAFGGTIFARAERTDLSTLADLATARIATATTESFGGYQVQAFQMLEAGVPLPRQERLVQTGMPQDKVVDAVLDGVAEVGFLRAGVLESLANESKLDLNRIRIINRRQLPGFPYAASTQLYPEWPVSVMPQVDEALAVRLTVALLSLPHDGEVARAMEIHGFTNPVNYSGVETLLRRLRRPPFDAAPDITLHDLWSRYAEWITALAVLLGLLAGAGAGLIALNERSRKALKEAERLAAQQDLLLSSLGEGLYGVDRQGVCTFVNPAALAMLGLEEHQVIGRNGHDAFHDRRPDGTPYPVAECPIHLTLNDGEARETEDAFLRDGRPFPVHLAITPMLRNSVLVGAVVAFRDISEHKAMEQALLRSNAELEQFAYAASHDLREPLRMVSSYLGLLERRLGDTLDQNCRDFLHYAKDGAQRMDRLILGLLDYSRIGRGSESRSRFRLAEAIEEALSNLGVLIANAHAQIVVADDLPDIEGHRMEIVRLLQNLIANAVKYRAPDRQPVVTVSACRRDGWCELAVADNGVGIPAEHRERIFGLFQRLHGHDIEGCGIGLASCKKILDHHGGRITVDGEPGQGSTFRVTLPAA
jgi:PAS domain S-box-containing protein